LGTLDKGYYLSQGAIMVITFDFDDTLLYTEAILDEEGFYDHAEIIGKNPIVYPVFEKLLNDPKNEVHIVTTRSSSSSQKTEDQLRKWGVLDKLAGVHFTDGQYKTETLQALGSKLHFDDDEDEIARVPAGCKGMKVDPHPSWTRLQNRS
jgi:acid phosphatase class B